MFYSYYFEDFSGRIFIISIGQSLLSHTDTHILTHRHTNPHTDTRTF